MTTPIEELTIAYHKVGNNGRVALTIRQGDEVLFMDELKITGNKARNSFADTLCHDRPGIDKKTIEAELLKIAAEVARAAPQQVESPTQEQLMSGEIDVSKIVRPELFFTVNVSGLAIPTFVRVDGQLQGRWTLYVQWADGRREAEPLAGELPLPDGAKLWFHPLPCSPADVVAPAWSQEFRRSWLDGAPAPDPAKVFQTLCQKISWLMDFPVEQGPGAIAVLALWTMLTYIYPAWDAIPYLYLGGPVGSGKSRVLDVLSHVVYRPTSSSNMTAPSLFRTLHQQGGVLLYDEAEQLRRNAPDSLEIVSMLLAGYHRGGRATRLEPVGDTFRPVSFDVYGPKALACVAGLPPALSSRCIQLTMFRAAKGSAKPRRRVNSDPQQWQNLRDDLHMLALGYGPTWLELSRQSDVCPAMTGRNYELWQPILALANWIGSHGAANLLTLVKNFANELIDAGTEDQTSVHDELMLRALADMLRGNKAPTAREILKRAVDDEANMFTGWSAKGVSNVLRRYGIKTRKSHGRHIYDRAVIDRLREVERTYGIELNLLEDTSS